MTEMGKAHSAVFLMNHNPNMRLCDFLDQQVETRPDAIGWWFDEIGAVTFSEMNNVVRQRQTELQQLGIVAGDRIMMVAENGIDIVSTALATWKCDAWFMPVNARLSAGEIDRLAEHALPKAIIYTAQISNEAAKHAKRRGNDVSKSIAVEILAQSKPERVFERADEQVAALMYTTGTTGSPKGVMLTHSNLAWYARVTQEFRSLTPRDRTYCALPLTHIYGFASAFLGNLYGGARLDVAARFDAGAMLNAVQDGVTILPAVPAMYAHLLDAAEARGLQNLHDIKLRYLMTGGAPLDVDWKRRVENFFHLPLHNGYGMTECAPGIASSKRMNIATSAEDISCGHPLPELDVELVPQEGEAELRDGVGEIVVRGPNIMKGYYRNPQETKKVMDADGFFHTGDLGKIDEEGRLSLVGRCKELIIRSGFNVYPPEVEQSLTRHPAITLAAVVGRAVIGNEEVLAFVQNVPETSVTEAELQAFIKDDLAPYKRPSRIIITDLLPASSTGKILKAKLLETFADRLEEGSTH